MIVAKYDDEKREEEVTNLGVYSVGEDPKFAVCSACGQKISRQT